MRFLRKTLALLTGALLLSMAAAQAEEVVDLGGSFLGNGRALLNKPAGKARAGLVLLTGGDGYVGIGADGSVARNGNWIVRTRAAYLRSGIASITLDGGADPAKAVEYMRGIAPRVIVVAMSRGALKVADTLAARPDGIVFASSILDGARGMIGDPGRLPPTLIIHHRQDSCRLTLPDSAVAFQQWTGGKARLIWIDGGSSTGDPCQARAYHGFIGREGQVVSAITSFAGSLR
ncbi:alpha/beta hydrolase [Bosea sp. ASV33]|uniref:alpha/beta hydrolase n=1 Tax=Bosea sp. ASV33 TaxID=2795106 RepID=UPI0018ED8947|nr:alpha/beta hydrolase [Bosea sp. ASV33]